MGGASGGGWVSSGLLAQNIANLAKKYPLGPDGKFGKPGKATAQVIESRNPLATAKEFYEQLSLGRESITSLTSGSGESASMGNRQFVVFRPSSKSGGPAISIRSKGSPDVDYKIHFLPEK